MADYDVIIIGAGPGGYVAAIRCAQLGLKTAVVEGRGALGGTCLNVGCIPSKALLHATHLLHEARHNFPRMGLMGQQPTVDWAGMTAYKAGLVADNVKGIEFLFRKNRIDWLQGWAKISGPGRVQVDNRLYSATSVIIASGSTPASLPGVEVDERIVVTSTGALDLPAIPEQLVVIGAGVIGLELGSVYARLGAKVQVIEYRDTIVPEMDAEIRDVFLKILTRQGISFTLGAAVTSVTAGADGARITYRPGQDQPEIETQTDVVLIATGRRPRTTGMNLESLGIKTTPSGHIMTDSRYRTSIPGIYAIGDVTTGPMLAHKAEDDGMACAEVIAGRDAHADYRMIPTVVYTTPEVAAVGLTEDQLKDQGQPYAVGRFPFKGNARAKTVFQEDGFVKLLTDRDSDRILGAHVIGPGAGDLIHEICVGMQLGAAAADIARTSHAHPTFSEAMREAALACGEGAIHV